MKNETSRSIEHLADAIGSHERILIGAGSGLSTSAGMAYSGMRFDRYFADFARKYGFRDMYSGGFAPFETIEEHWAFWSRNIWINRYAPIPKDTYGVLLDLVRDKDYFVLTTNVDHCFQRAGFDKSRLFYTQGDYGLFQCSLPCCDKTWDNYESVKKMVEAQGFVVAEDGTLEMPGGRAPLMEIPSDLVPMCPNCGRPLTMNLRVDGTFVEDAGWKAASEYYGEYLNTQLDSEHNILLFELGVGGNTPVIIKYPFWRMTANDPGATYACVNLSDTYAPDEIRERSILIDGDIDETLRDLRESVTRERR